MQPTARPAGENRQLPRPIQNRASQQTPVSGSFGRGPFFSYPLTVHGDCPIRSVNCRVQGPLPRGTPRLRFHAAGVIIWGLSARGAVRESIDIPGEKTRVRVRCRRGRHRRRGNHHLPTARVAQVSLPEIKFLASRRSAGKQIRFAGKSTRSRSCGRRSSTASNWPSQHAGRGGPRLHPRGGAPRLPGDRRERLLADGSQGAAGHSRGQSRRRSAVTRGSSPVRTARPRKWCRR